MAIPGKHILWLLPLSALAVAAGHFIFLYYLYHIPTSIALTDCIISVCALSLCFWGVTQAIKIYPTRVGVTLYSLVIAVFFGFSTVYLSTTFIKWWLEPVNTAYLDFLHQSGPVRYIIYWLLCSWAATYLALNKSINTQEKQFKEQADASALLKEAELFKLRQQLQPHFLYNSLNSISALTIIEPAKAQEMIGLLSDFLRQSVQREAKQLIPLADELNYLDKYLCIEAIRFGDRLEVAFQNSAPGTAQLPPLLLQPLLENAIKFGLYGNTGKVDIVVNISLQANALVLTIANPVHADTGNHPKGTGFGLAGVQRRLYLLYSRTDLLDTATNGTIFTTTLTIPQLHV